jgi:hypothetical protein
MLGVTRGGLWDGFRCRKGSAVFNMVLKERRWGEREGRRRVGGLESMSE